MMSTVGSIIMSMISYAILLNIGLGVFNLIPLPPLDGSKIFKPFLPTNVKYFFEDNERIFYFIFIFIWVTGIAGNLISPIINLISNGIINLGCFIFGL